MTMVWALMGTALPPSLRSLRLAPLTQAAILLRVRYQGVYAVSPVCVETSVQGLRLSPTRQTGQAGRRGETYHAMVDVC